MEQQLGQYTLNKPWTDPSATPFIRIQNVTKNYGAFTAVDNISLDIYQGELFCLLGGSGCGKSTLLRMLSGFEDITGGTVEIDGQDMTGVPPYERPVNMMFQSYALFPHMSVMNNIAYGLKRDGMAKAEINTRVEEMLSLVQLEEFAKRKPHQLSGGQRQRVALARALAKKPKLLLLDEPLGALDKKLREETQFELVNIQEELGVTFIVVTHDQEEAMTLSTRIGVMDKGRIIQVGEPRDIYEYPQSRFVADFVGSVNLFEGVISTDNEKATGVRSPEAESELRVGHSISCVLNQKVAFAVRPEKIKISRTKPKQKHNVCAGKVDDIAYLGGQSVYLIKLASGKMLRVTTPNTDRRKDAITWEEDVYVSWDDSAGVVLVS
ncbi:MAG: polyamine ABC transporter ATP-binding protein [Hyphomicrobiales bacterium]